MSSWARVRMIDSKEVARRFGLSRAWVYEHAGELGAVAIGDGPRPRLRFVPSLVAGARLSSLPQPEGGLAIHGPRVRSSEAAPRSVGLPNPVASAQPVRGDQGCWAN